MIIAFFARDIKPKWESHLCLILNYCQQQGYEMRYYSELYDYLNKNTVLELNGGEIFTSYEQIKDVDILISLGGDGTLLRSLPIVRDSNVPVVGINFGKLGFLTAIKLKEDDNLECFKTFTRGAFKPFQLPVLKLSSDSVPSDIYPYALNEISIQRTTPSLITIDVRINGVAIPTYWADGLMIATATGSTAYSLSVGGPIVMPGADVFIITPIAPHNLNVRPLIVPDNSELELSVNTNNEEVLIALDNRLFKAQDGVNIKISKADFHLRNVSLSETSSSFFNALREKLSWGEDKRNYI